MKKFLKLSLLSTALVSTAFVPFFASAQSTTQETLRLLDQFGDVFDKVRRDYVEEVTDKKLIEAAINGMLTDLDPHSSFLNSEDFKDMREQTKGEFGGLGIEVTMKNGLVYVVTPIDDTPAFRAGIKAGDYISHIDGDAVYGMTIGEAVKKMRGKPDSKITVKVIREGEKKPFDVDIVRDIIVVNSVRSEIHDDVGYIRITSFTEKTGKSLEEEIEKQIKEIGADKIKGFVLDLRNNPGGLLTEAISVSDAFLNKGEIVSTRGRHNEDSQKFSATFGDVTNDLPVVVIINSGSASASEIVAGALQDHRRAVIIGEKSFGKGSVQTVIPLPSESAIRLTTSRYYTPSGNSIQAKGIEPDIIVEQAKLEITDKVGRTSEAELRGHLINDNDEELEKLLTEEIKADDKKTKEEIRKEKEENVKEIIEEIDEKQDDADIDNKVKKTLFDDKDKEKEKDIYDKDYQLGRALDMVRAIFLSKGK